MSCYEHFVAFGRVEATRFSFPIFAYGENWERKRAKVPLCRRRKGTLTRRPRTSCYEHEVRDCVCPDTETSGDGGVPLHQPAQAGVAPTVPARSRAGHPRTSHISPRRRCSCSRGARPFTRQARSRAVSACTQDTGSANLKRLTQHTCALCCTYGIIYSVSYVTWKTSGSQTIRSTRV